MSMDYNFQLIAFLILVFLYGASVAKTWLSRLKVIRALGCRPPPSLPQRDPFFGLDVTIQIFRSIKENRRNLSIQEQFDVLGHTFQSKSYDRMKFFTIEPRNLQSIFATDFDSWGVQPMRLFAFEPFIGKGLICTDGPFWQHSRSLIKPIFSRTQIADVHLSMFAIHVEKLFNLLPRDGSMVDLQPLFARLALDSSTEFLFGESVGSLNPETVSINAKAFLEAYSHGQKCVGKRLQLPQWNFLTRDKQFKESCKTAHDFVQSHLEKAISNKTKRANNAGQERFILAEQLINETDDLNDIQSQLLNIFLPAHDAAGVAISNVFFHLARNPAVYEKLHREINAHDASETEWTFERLKSQRYLQHVINESLRLNPTLGTTTRIALKDTTLPVGGGSSGQHPIFVKKGDTVTSSFFALHRRPDIFGSDAHIFRPERWESENFRPYWGYLPFMGGPRVCPGQQLGLMEVGYVTVKFMQRFKSILNRDPVLEFVEDYKMSTTSRNGVKVSLIPV